MLTDIGNTLHDVAVATWALRWPIAAAFVFAAVAWLLDRHLADDRRRMDELNAEQARADLAEQRLATLQHATGVLAVTVAGQDTPAPWIPAQRDGSSR